MSGPTFLVVGGARCGTSALVEGLRAHPAIFVTEPKEPHYFAFHATGAHFTAPGDEHTVNRVSVTDRDAYLALYPREHDYVALGDGSVSTMYYHQQALPEVVATNPAMKLVVLLREPVDRAYSAYQYMRGRGLEPVEDFLDAVALEEERRAAGWHHMWHYTAMSYYADAIEAMQRVVPAEQLGVFFYDDLQSDYDGTLERVRGFLGAAPLGEDAAEVPRVNISGSPRSRLLHAGLTAATASPRVRASVKRMTSYRFRERVRRTVLRRDGLPAAAVEALGPRYVEDLTRLRALLDDLVPGPVPAWLDGAS